MTPDLLYALKAFAAIAGWAVVAAAIYRAIFVLANPVGPARTAATSGAVKAAIFAGVALVISATLPGGPVGEKPPLAFGETGLKLPIIWPVLPFDGWLALVCLIWAIARIGKSITGFAGADKASAANPKQWAATIGIMLVGYISFTLMRNDKDALQIVRGQIPFSVNAAVGLALLLVAAFVVMIVSARAARVRNVGKAVATHTALVAGTIVFGVPFVWLLISSFKEERDLSNAQGLVWIPKVSLTKPYRDPAKPYYQFDFDGETAEGYIVNDQGGQLEMDIQRPLGLRGRTAHLTKDKITEVDQQAPMVTGKLDGQDIQGIVVQEMPDGKRHVRIETPASLAGKEFDANPTDVDPVRKVGLRFKNYPEALEYLPKEALHGLMYIWNTVFLVLMNLAGTLLTSTIVAYAFARLKFPAKKILFTVMLSTMMLPAAVTLMPQFLVFRSLHFIDTLVPLWAPAFFGSAFNIFMLREFFSTIPTELEDAGKIDGCSYFKTFWSIMLPQIKPALAVVSIWTLIGVWNNFMGPLIYINSPEKMPISYALQLFAGDRFGEPHLLMAFAVMGMLPVLLVFAFAQRYFIEGVALSGLGGR